MGGVIDTYSVLSARLDAQTGYGLPLGASVLLLPVVLPALVIVGRRRAAWLAVPALRPSQQWYYASLALPVRSALVGAIIALPLEGSGALATIALAVAELHRARRSRRAEATQDQVTPTEVDEPAVEEGSARTFG